MLKEKRLTHVSALMEVICAKNNTALWELVGAKQTAHILREQRGELVLGLRREERRGVGQEDAEVKVAFTQRHRTDLSVLKTFRSYWSVTWVTVPTIIKLHV